MAPAPDTAPERAETGTQNHEGVAGAAAAVEFLACLATGETRRERLRGAFCRLRETAGDLLTRLWDSLTNMSGIRVYGPSPSEPRTPTIAFTVDGVSSLDVARRLARSGIFVSHGDFYAATVIERLGLGEDGVVRVGCACYTTREEVDRLLNALRHGIRQR